MIAHQLYDTNALTASTLLTFRFQRHAYIHVLLRFGISLRLYIIFVL